MSPFDQTAKSITALRRKVETGKITPEEGEKKIAALKKKGARWVARWTLANGREATKVCRSEREAKNLEARMSAAVEAGDASTPANVRATVAQIVEFYLDNKLKGKGSFGSASAHLKKAVELIGSTRLDRINARADEILPAYIFETAAGHYASRKTLWNHKVYLSAAFAFWIRRKRLQMVNPWVVVDFPNPGSTRTETPSFDAYSKILAVAGNGDYPAWVKVALVIAWEHGRRGGEIHGMDWSDVHLSPAAEDLPWARFQTLKQRKVVFEEVPLYADATAALRGLWKGETEGRVFPVGRSTFDNEIRAVFHAAGFPAMWKHDFRRAWNNRHRTLSSDARMAMSGHKSEEMDARYWTERRKGLESVVASSYVLSGDFREIAAKVGDSESETPAIPRRGRDSNPKQHPNRGTFGQSSPTDSDAKSKVPAIVGAVKGNQNPQHSHASREIGREIEKGVAGA